MARIKLTAGRVREFKCIEGAAQSFLWDSEVPGLAVRATANGAKAYIFQGRLAGKSIRVTIGDVRHWDIEGQHGAREESRRLQILIDQGIDPRHDKRERIAATTAKNEASRRQSVSVEDAWDSYVNVRRHKWSARHLQDHSKLAHKGGAEKKTGNGVTREGPLAALMPLKLVDLTPEQVEAWLKKETAHRPTRAALAYRLLRAFIRWCASQAEYKAVANVEAVGSRMSRDHVPRSKAKEADCLQREQLAAWFGAVRKLRNPIRAAYLQGLLLTGARREELAWLKWSDVDFKWNSLTLRDKVEGERIIPLTPYLAQILAALPRRSEWVFSSRISKSGRLQEPRIAHMSALNMANLPHMTVHGLRRSFGTLAEWVEAPTGVIAQIQGHKPSAIAEKHYRRRPIDLLRMWHTRIEAWMLEQAGIEQPTSSTGEGRRPPR